MLAFGGGIIGALAVIAKADHDATVESFTRAIAQDNGMYIGSWRDVTANYTMSWVAGIIAVLGVIMLIAALTIRAAHPKG